MNQEQKKHILEQAGFRCKKCGYYSPTCKGIEVNQDFAVVLCNICNTFSPTDEERFYAYINEKINWQNLETFRKTGANKASHLPHKQGMIEKSKQGELMARPAFGYKVINGKLVPDEENSENVRHIFHGFLNGKSLNKLAKEFNISVNGIKKILKNFTYIGKIKFDNQIITGHHIPLLPTDIFNSVQHRFEAIKKNKNTLFLT